MDIPSKYCHHCGKQIQFVSKFCAHCGTSQASLDEKPPVEEQPRQPLNRLQQQTRQPRPPAQTFQPRFASTDDDDDDEGIRADKVGSLSELGIDLNSIASLDVDIRVFTPPKETIGGIVREGASMSQAAVESQIKNGRPSGPVDQAAVMAQIAAEAKTLRG